MTSQRLLDRIVVVLGEHTDGGESDLDTAVALAMSWIQAGFVGPKVFVGEHGLPYGYLTEAVKTRTRPRRGPFRPHPGAM